MGRWDSDADDWRGWKDGKYDNRYRGVNRGRNYRRRNKTRSLTVGIVFCLIIGVFGFVLWNQGFLDSTIDQSPQVIQDASETAKDLTSETTEKLSKTVNDQLENPSIKSVEKTFDKISDTVQKTAKTIPETKITIPKVEIPKYEPPKQYSLQELRQIALNDINKYRKEQGVGLLVLGYAKSSQLYSEELLNEGCIHHISDRGEGPMLRYQNNNDQMYLVAENIAGGSGTIWNTPDDEVVQGNYRMMFEDADSNWGHKINILDSQHQSVSIGIAYDSQRLVMVQDFESVLPPGYQYDPSSFMTEPVDQRLCW